MSVDQASVLYYSDDPETLTTPAGGQREGVLFDFDIIAAKRQRFLFYHVNGDRAPRYVAVRLYNTTDSAAELKYIASLPAGSAAYMHVGHASTSGFVRALAQGDWRTVQSPPDQNVVLASVDLAQEALAAGLFEFELPQGTALRCSVIACDTLDDVARVARSGATFALDSKGRRGKFDISTNPSITLNHTVGGAMAHTAIGNRDWQNQEPQPNGTPGIALKGEYGVFTTLSIQIDNPGPDEARVALYESAHGGDSTATYLIDGRLVESDRMISTTSPPRYKVWIYTVAPSSSVTSTVLTMPDSGSSSPVWLILDEDDNSPNPGGTGSIVRVSPIET